MEKYDEDKEIKSNYNITTEGYNLYPHSMIEAYQLSMHHHLNNLDKQWFAMSEKEKQFYALKIRNMSQSELENNGIESNEGMTGYDLFIYERM